MAAKRTAESAHLRSRGEHPSRPAGLGALCQFVIQEAPVMHPSESTGAARPLAGTDRPTRPLTAACVERTGTSGGTRCAPPVHLHLRGEHSPQGAVTAGASGLPPLARRGRERIPDAAAAQRFTSACAESTWARRASACDRVAHLRLRGEDSSPIVNRGRVTGSPPPARRGLPGKDTTSGELRFTSACLRGEVEGEEESRMLLRGLPPPERRGPCLARGNQVGGRFTSA